MRTTQAIILATSLLITGIATAPTSSNFQAREILNVKPRFIVAKRSGSVLARNIVATMYPTLYADQAIAATDKNLVNSDTTAVAGANAADLLAVAALTASQSVVSFVSTNTASLLAKSNAASSKATIDDATYTAAFNANALVVADNLQIKTNLGYIAEISNSIPGFKALILNAVPNPDKYNLHALTTSYITALDSYRASGNFDDANLKKNYDAAADAISDVMNYHYTEVPDYSSAIATLGSKMSFLPSIRNSLSQAKSQLAIDLVNAPSAQALADALATSTASDSAAITALAGYNTVLGLSKLADSDVGVKTPVKIAADQLLAKAQATLSTDQAKSDAADNKVLLDKNTILQEVTDIYKYAQDARTYIYETRVPARAALQALTTAQSNLQTDTVGIQTASSAYDHAVNNAAASVQASASAVLYAKSVAAALVLAQTAYNTASAKSIASSKVYGDASTKYSAMIHGGLKNAALVSVTSLKSSAGSDAAATLAALSRLNAAQSVDSAAKKNVAATAATVITNTANVQSAGLAITAAKTKVTNDNASIVTATAAYNLANGPYLNALKIKQGINSLCGGGDCGAPVDP